MEFELTIIIASIIIIGVVAVIVADIRNKKKGKGSCSCGGSCGSCGMNGSCHSSKK